MNIIQIQIANDLNSKSQNKSLKMFNILVGTRTLTKNYQTFMKSPFGAMNEISRVFAPLLFRVLRLPIIPSVQIFRI